MEQKMCKGTKNVQGKKNVLGNKKYASVAHYGIELLCLTCMACVALCGLVWPYVASCGLVVFTAMATT